MHVPKQEVANAHSQKCSRIIMSTECDLHTLILGSGVNYKDILRFIIACNMLLFILRHVSAFYTSTELAANILVCIYTVPISSTQGYLFLVEKGEVDIQYFTGICILLAPLHQKHKV